MAPDHVAVEEGDRAPAFLDELAVHDLGERRFAGARQPGEEQRDALLAGGRIDGAQRIEHLRIGEPVGYVLAERDAAGEVRVVELHRVLLRGAAVADRHVAACRRRVAEAAGRGDRDTELRLVLAREVLRGAAWIEHLAPGRIEGCRTCVVALHDEVGAPVVAPDDRVPESFPRAGAAHREGEQGHGREMAGKVPQDLLVALDARELAQIAVHGDAHHGMQEQMGPGFLGRGDGQLALAPVHRAARMEADDPPPPEPVEETTQIVGRMAQLLVVVVRGKLDAGDAAAHVDAADPFVEVPYSGMAFGGRSVHPLRLGALVGNPLGEHLEHCEDEPFLIA